MEFEDIIRRRTSTRKFSTRKIEKEKLDKILEAGRLAPTAKNNQPIKIYVIESDEGLNKIDKASRCRYGAPTVLLICGNKDEAYHKEEYSTYEMDASIVTTHMMMEIQNLGLGTTWIGSKKKKKIMETYDVPTNWVPVAILPIPSSFV